MVISLGSISLKTEPRREDSKDVAAMHVSGVTSEEILKEIMDQAYDKFNLNIDNIQVGLVLRSIDDPHRFLNNKKIFLFCTDYISQTNGPLARCLNSGKNIQITYFRADITASESRHVCR